MRCMTHKGVLAAMCIVAGALFVSAAPAVAAKFSLETHFGAEGTGSGQFKTPHGVAVESATGDVFVVDQKNNRVEKWEREAGGGYKVVGEITYPEFHEPSAVAVDDSSGSFKGDVYVASGNTTGTGGGTVDQFKPKVSDPDEYEFVQRIEAPNSEPNIGAVAVDPTTGDVGITAANFVDVYNPSTGEPIPGEALNETGHTVTGLVLDGAHAYVTTSAIKSGELIGALERWGLNGKYELKGGRTVLFEEATSAPKLTALALDTAGNAYVNVEEAGSSHVDVFAGVEGASGLIVPTEFGAGEIGESHGIGWSSDNGGIVYVSNPGSDDVLVFGPPPPPAPVNTGLPSITGTAREGKTLTATTGTWEAGEAAPESYAYQWEECNTAGEACSSIVGATEHEYTLTSADVGHTIRVVVTATNKGGSVSATSEPTAEVQKAGALEASQKGTVEGEVPQTTRLESTCGKVNLGEFLPGVEADYHNTCTLTVTATGEENTLTASDESATHTGHLVQGAYYLADALETKAKDTEGLGGVGGSLASLTGPVTLLTYATPVSADNVEVEFNQPIGKHDPLHTGKYAKTITLTLTQTKP
jgi:hypothetical protein